MSNDLRIGLIGLDTSHVSAFTRLLHDEQAPHHVSGARVVAGFPGPSSDFDKSIERVDQFTDELRDQRGVEIVDSPQAAAEAADLVMITAVDGRAHRDFFEKIASMGKPVFIDKPFATSEQDARAMTQLADQHGIALMSCSAVRYSESFTAAMNHDDDGPVVGIDVFGPMAIIPTLPGLFWYGIHCVEMVVKAMGSGCRRVRVAQEEGYDLIVMEWADGRVATMRGQRQGHKKFGGVVHRESGFDFYDVTQDNKPFYAYLLEAILRSLPNGRSEVPTDQMLEVVRIAEAANQARQTGQTVNLSGQ